MYLLCCDNEMVGNVVCVSSKVERIYTSPEDEKIGIAVSSMYFGLGYRFCMING